MPSKCSTSPAKPTSRNSAPRKPKSPAWKRYVHTAGTTYSERAVEYSLYVKLADGFVLDLNITLFEMSNKHTDIELVAYVVDGQGNDMELYSETLHTKRYIDEEELDIQSHIGALLTSSASSLDILGDGLVDSFNATIED